MPPPLSDASASNRRQRSNTTPAQPHWSPSCATAPLPAPPPPRRSPIHQLRQRFSGSSLKRQATSPVYLDGTTAALASMPATGSRRVAQCASNRVRTSDSDVASISSQDETGGSPRTSGESPPNNEVPTAILKEKDKEKRRKASGQRNKWTKEETAALVKGCNKFAIGQWKTIRDSEPLLAKRSPGDLKDRFRTYFPDAYRQHYPNAKTHISSRVRSVDPNGNPIFGENAVRKERKQFSIEEDEALKRGYIQFGTAWSSIQRDPILASRKATDLRDRFRNAFPDLYAAAGYKPRARKGSVSNVYGLMNPAHQHDTFEAIDLSVCSGYPSRALGQLRTEQYQLPSLDFLKAHGAEAFSELRMIYASSQSSGLDDTGLVDEPQAAVAAVANLALPSHLANTTPRPNVTPRPNDTTPRPRKAVSGMVESELTGEPFRPLRQLHKAQSSMDLTQFSNLHLVDSPFHALPPSHSIGPNLYSPTFTDHLDFGASPAVPYVNGTFFHGSTPELSYVPLVGERGAGAGLSSAEGAHECSSNTTDWLRELDIASQTFPSAFDLSGFSNIMMNQDAASSVSSLLSSEHSVEISDDRVVYTGGQDRSALAVQSLQSQPPKSLSLSSQEAQGFFCSATEAEAKADQEAVLMMMIHQQNQLGQQGTSKGAQTGALETTLCPPAPSDQLLMSQNSTGSIMLEEDAEIGRF